MKPALRYQKRKRVINSCFRVIDAYSGKPSLFYNITDAYQVMGEEARSKQQDFARRVIKLKQDLS